jgi:hypothetical protein
MRELAAARTWLTVFQLPAYAPELNLCVPRMSSTALTSRVALPAVRP